MYPLFSEKLWLGMAIAFLSFTPLLAQEEKKVQQDLELELLLDNRFFFQSGLYEGQERNYLSLAARPEYSLESANGQHNFKVALFGRWDQHDDHRTHLDVRELYYQWVKGNLELSIGAKKVFWGVTESVHLVDIINQTDQVESFDGEQKLGQPMLQLSYLTNFGTFDFFYLPFARKRQFPDQGGRLRFPEVIERDDLLIDSDIEEWHPSFALRWSHYFGPIDLGISHFYGVGREPLFNGLNPETGNLNLFYPIINQTGLDFQATTGPWLWKMESIYRQAEAQDFVALDLGLEYTFGNIASSGIDLGLVAEYLFDSRDELAFSSLANDVFGGIRLAFNDVQSTDFLVGAIVDLEEGTTFFSLEGSRRIGQSWKAEVELRNFFNVSPQEFANFFRQDDFL
ncbi:MAG: hypothetical protein AAFU64_10645, partial [Bacteroidota bacterium]